MLYAAYKDWARNGGQYVHTSTKFGMEMAKLCQKVKGKYRAKYFGLMSSGDEGDEGDGLYTFACTIQNKENYI